jgi:outer membrane protein OmpA-like peptidoglycan-associated protein
MARLPQSAEVIMSTWTTRLRGGAAGSALIVLIATALPAAAADGEPGRSTSGKEAAGLATGATLGGFAAGPFGVIIGAAAGAWLGDRFHRESSARRTAVAELATSREHNTRLEADVDSLAALLDRVHELETDVGFRTEEASVPPDAAEKLYRLGMLLAAMPDTQVRISGYADARGADGYNLALSERRAAAVSAELAKAGVPGDRLILEAHGESDATGSEGDVDTQALERRVTVRVERGAVAVAQGR